MERPKAGGVRPAGGKRTRRVKRDRGRDPMEAGAVEDVAAGVDEEVWIAFLALLASLFYFVSGAIALFRNLPLWTGDKSAE